MGDLGLAAVPKVTRVYLSNGRMTLSKTTELRTSDVAKEIGVAADLLRKWKYRGFLKLAPQGVAGQGRGVECFWSEAAVEEARAWAATPRASGRNRTRR